MSLIVVLLELAKAHPVEGVAFTILFGWLWHSVARPERLNRHPVDLV